MRASHTIVPGTFSGGNVECGTFCGAAIEPGTFHGATIEPGTFHGATIEPGTFHHWYPEEIRRMLSRDAGSPPTTRQAPDRHSTLPVVEASEIPHLVSEPRQEPPIPPNTETPEKSSLN